MFSPRIPSLGALPSSGFVPGRRLGAAPGGFTGVVDDVPGAVLAITTSQPATEAYFLSGNPAVTYRNGTTSATGTLAWVDGKFDSIGWDSASNNGTEILFCTIANDNISTNDGAQITEAKQGILTREGGIQYDGSNDNILSPYMLGNGDNFSICVFGSDNGSVNNNDICSQWETGATTWIMRVSSTSLKQLTLFLRIAGTKSFIFDVPSYFDGSNPDIIFTYDSAVGVKCYANGVLQSSTGAIPALGTVDNLLGRLTVPSTGGISGFAKQTTDGIIIYERTLTPAETLTAHNRYRL